MITLYHCADARSFRALWALEELRLAYELKLLPFPPRVLAPDYLAENPLGTIPLLVDGTTRMTESAAIVQYLATRDGPTPLSVEPGDPAYGDWLNGLKDTVTRMRLIKRLQRAGLGNLGDVKPVGEGVYEMREFFGPGWRMYYVQQGDVLLIMLGGGDKSSQQRDIERAIQLSKEL